MYELTVCLANEKDNWDIFSAIGPTVAALIAIGIAIWQAVITHKQKKINAQQKELQRCSFVYDAFIREKQEKLIKLRKLYLSFQTVCIDFISLIFPNSLSQKDIKPGEIPNIDLLSEIDNDVQAIYFLKSITIKDTTYFETSRDICVNLNNFLIENDVFLQDNPELYQDLKITSQAFLEFFSSLQDKDFYKILLPLVQKLNKIGIHKEIFYSKEGKENIKILRKYFYEFMQGRLVLSRNNCGTGLLYMIPNTFFSVKKPFYTPENIEKWSQNDKIAFTTHSIFVTWFETWKQYINSFFSVSFDDINRVIKNDK